MSITRRKFLGWLGAATAGTTLGKTAKAASNKQFSGYPQSMGVLFDNTRCIGCRKCEEGCNTVNELPAEIHTPPQEAGEGAFRDLAGISIEQAEKQLIRNTLRMVGGNREQAANILGIGERTLYRKIKEYGLKE